MSLSLENFIGSAVSNILDGVHDLKSFILVLTPPGSSRGEIVRRLAGKLEDVEFLVYEELYKRLNDQDLRSRFKPLRGLSVEGKDILEYIKGDYSNIKEALSTRRVAIVPRSTMDAVVLVRRLREELGRDWGSAKKHVVINHLSSIFKRELEESRSQFTLIETRHELLRRDDVVKELVRESEGISLALWNREGKLGEKLESGVKAIRALSPGSVGFDELARDFAGELKVIMPTVVLTSVAYVAGAMLVAPVIQALVLADGLTAISLAIGRFLEEFTKRVGIYAVKEPIKKFSERFLGWLTKKGEARNKFLKSMGQLLKAVIVAQEFVVDDRFEGIVDEVASEWGLDVDTFRNFIDNTYKVATQRVATKEDVDKIQEEMNKILEEVDKRLTELEKKVEELTRDIEKIEGELETTQVLEGVYRDPTILGINLERKTLRVEDVEYALVVDKNFENYSREIMDRIARGDFVILTGSKGIGKSVLIKYSLAELLKSKVSPYVVYEAKELTVVHNVKRLHYIADNAFGEVPIIYYDPSVPEHYEPGQDLTPETKVANTVKQLMRFYQRRSESGKQVPVMLVLPSDVLQLVIDNLLMNNKGLETYEVEFVKERVVNIDLRTSQFLSGVIRSYSGGICAEEVYERLGKEVYERYRDGYTLVARYVGEWLKANKCSVEDVEQAIGAGAGVAKAFISQYIYKAILGGDDDIESFKEKFRKYALAFAARAFLGRMPPKWLIGRVPAVINNKGKSEIAYDVPIHLEFPDHVGRWLSMKHEDLIEETIEDIIDGKLSKELKKYEGVGRLGTVVNGAEGMEKVIKWTLDNLMKIKGSINVKVAVIDVFFTAAANRLLSEEEQVLRSHPHELAMVVGLAHTPYPIPIELLLETDEGELVKELRDWILVGNEMPPSVRVLLHEKASLFRDFIDACGMVNELYREVKESGRVKLTRVFEALGLLVITGGEFGKECLDKANRIIGKYIEYVQLAITPIHGLKELARRLIENGEYDEMVRLLHKITLQDQNTAEEIHSEVVLPNHDVFHARLSWAGKLIYMMTLSRLSKVDDWTRLASETVNDICRDESLHGVRCLYAKARSYPLIAVHKSMIGKLDEANKYVDEAVKAMEELSKRSREELVRGLENALRLRSSFMDISETIDKELKSVRAHLYHHTAIVKMNVDLGVALNYAKEVCDISREIGLMNDIASTCGLRARLNFLSGNVENGVKEFGELWKEALDKTFTEMDRGGVSSTLAHYLVSLLAVNDLSRVEEEYGTFRPFLVNKPIYWAIVAGLMRVYGLRVEDFYEARRDAIMEEAPTPFRKVLLCLEVDGECETMCQSIEDLDDRILCCELIQAKDNPKLMKSLIISTPKEKYRDILSQLLKDIDDPYEITEIGVSPSGSFLSFVEVLRFIIEGKLNKARLIAEFWRNDSRSRGKPVPEGLWNELGKSLSGDRCSNDCRMALIKLFYLQA
ncbi:hypothetical protein DFR88_00850 [Metallosphaera sedula]|uniref:Uncharacterized protein n=1 Tax=Metallosphaera prunae TaxID=47304 RepID=A0A4D8S2T3_METPR|nr:hypothetical protein [Metallosphaera prunae]QCO29215.1 hypothetical protein DFR88_00850 [Metallosphaera prunae]